MRKPINRHVLANLAARLLTAREQLGQAKRIEEKAKADLLQVIGGRRYTLADEYTLQQVERSKATFNAKLLKLDHPEIWKSYAGQTSYMELIVLAGHKPRRRRVRRSA